MTVKDYNIVAEDKTLSLKAKGMFLELALLVDMEGRFCSQDTIKKFVTDGSDSIRSALKELENHGYLTRYRHTMYDDGTFIGMWYCLIPKPIKPDLPVFGANQE